MMSRQNKREMLEEISRAVGIPPSEGFNGSNCVKRELVIALHERIVDGNE